MSSSESDEQEIGPAHTASAAPDVAHMLTAHECRCRPRAARHWHGPSWNMFIIIEWRGIAPETSHSPFVRAINLAMSAQFSHTILSSVRPGVLCALDSVF